VLASLKDLYERVFPPWTPIRDLDSLADFIDEHAAFVTQKGIFEYSRARAGHYSKVLFREPDFLAASERSRWGAYPLGLAMVGEIAEGILRPSGQPEQQTSLRAINELVLSVFDRYPVPAQFNAETWGKARSELARHLAQVGLHPPKRAMDVPEQYVDSYFALMPIHRSLRGSDYPAIKNYLRVTLCNIHDELSKRMDAAVIGELLQGRTT
jgi:hypothetical protein